MSAPKPHKNTAGHRAKAAHHAAKKAVRKKKCNECNKQPCDAALPEDVTTREVALTIFAEANPTSDNDEFEGIASVIHNRVGKQGFGKPKDIHSVLTKTYFDRKKGKTMYQFQGYQNPRYKKGESKNLDTNECLALKKSIDAAQKIAKDGVPEEHQNFLFFAAAKDVSKAKKASGTVLGSTVFGPKEF
ncbi:MAG: hypothetical protein U0359_31510 [Byssovorax sp.]